MTIRGKMLLALVAGTMAVPASALTFNLTYAGTENFGAAFSVTGKITTTNTTTTVGGREAYTITGITGTRNGVAINQLSPAGTVLDNAGNVTGLLFFDSEPRVNFIGFGYGITGDARIFNVYYNGGAYREYIGYQQGDSTVTSFSVTPAAVPEPASWAFLIGGFGAIGFAARRRSQWVRAAYA